MDQEEEKEHGLRVAADAIAGQGKLYGRGHVLRPHELAPFVECLVERGALEPLRNANNRDRD